MDNDAETQRPAAPSADTRSEGDSAGRVLLVEDNEALARATVRLLTNAGFVVEHAADGTAATDRLMSNVFEAVVSDITLPGTSGVNLLRTIRAYDLDLPVLLVTGNPSIETAIEAVELGALQYLVKPVENDLLVRAVTRAVRLNRLARLKRDALKLAGEAAENPGDRAGLTARFESALENLWMAFQPIVDLRKNVVYGYEALMRSREPSMPSPLDVLHAAERLDRISQLGARVRARATEAFTTLKDKNAMLFLNLHTTELLDPTLYEGSSPLSKIASRVVLEVTERSAIEKVQDVKARVSVLRFHGYRLAVDDLGAGYAGLTSFVTLEPDIVKLDMSLVRDIDSSKIRQQLVKSVVDLCRQLGMTVVAEGVETSSELRTIRLLGCDLAQGYFIGRPSDKFQPIEDLNV